MFITNGGIADFVIVAAKTEPDAGHQGITMFIVEQGQEGFAASTPLPKMGWHASDTRELTFDGCFVPDDRVLGGMNRGFYQIMTCFETERILLAAMGVGLAQAALDDARAYAVEREAFGSPIATYQAVRHKLSDMAVDVEAARLVTYWAAARLEAGDPEAPSASAMAKLQAAATANRVADDAVQVFGGYGFIDETRVAMHYRDARILRIGGGTDEILREIVARRMGL
jgi:acyl-CoA dehydrogenase